jgi:hypothetical protein
MACAQLWTAPWPTVTESCSDVGVADVANEFPVRISPDGEYFKDHHNATFD